MSPDPRDVVRGVSYVEGVMGGDVLGVEGRRRWSDGEKFLIVSSVGIDGATVTQVSV
jgi:hypothetical protein